MPTACKIMDFGCGTGLFGEVMLEKGFKNLDGIDGSTEMLSRAQEKGVYKHLAEQFLGMPEKFPKRYHGEYDIVVAMSCIGPQNIE